MVSCKSYEKAGGINYIQRFNTTEQDLPVLTHIVHTGNDSSLLLIHLHFSEYNNQKNLPVQLKLFTSLLIDNSNEDKFSFPPIIQQYRSAFTVNTARDSTLSIPFPLRRNEKGWYQLKMFTSDSSLYVKRIEPFNKENLNDISFYRIYDSEGKSAHPSYLHTHKRYILSHLNPTNEFILTRYQSNPNPAAPIFFSKPSAGFPEKTEIKFNINANEYFTIDSAGYYFLQRYDDSSGTALLFHENNFPELETAEDLIPPLRYISRNDEYKKLIQAADFKAQLDSFWIARCNDINIARRSIKLYYSRVEFANRHFTTYKEGWKTDPGIVYIMFGAPQKCYKFKAGEIWIYTNLPAQTEFVFLQKQHPLYPNYLELRRESEYLNIWNGQSFKWRTGKMVNEPQ